MRKIIRRAAAVLLSAALLLTGTASAAARIDPVEERLAAMSLREKVGQLFVVRVEALDPSGQSDSTRLTLAERQGLKKYPVGGIVVFRQNVKSPEQLKKLLADFQAASGTGLLTAVDEEGGSVARLANASGFDLPQYQSAQAVGTTGNPANARAMGQIIGGYLKTYGLNLDFAPVADVNTNPANTVIGNRAFSSDPAVAAQMVASAVQGFHDAGILCTLKHFPGHGDTAEDSHYGTASSTKTWAEMRETELKPFAAGIAAGADVVMTAHITTPNATQDGLPCWVSVKQFSKNDTATACQDWLRSTRLGRGSIKSHVRTVKVLGMGLFAFQERIHLWKGVTH